MNKHAFIVYEMIVIISSGENLLRRPTYSIKEVNLQMHKRHELTKIFISFSVFNCSLLSTFMLLNRCTAH